MRKFIARSVMLLTVVTLLAAGAAPVEAGSRKYVALSVGYSHSCALTARGEAYCWGYNGYGQLGNGTWTDSGVNGPQAVAGGRRFTQISAGTYHTCAITARGEAYCWGYNGDGQLGNNSTTNSNIPVAVADGLRFSSIGAGEDHTCGLTTRGQAYCWGRNRSSVVLGTGAGNDSSVPVAVAGNLRFTKLSVGGYHTCGLTSRGEAHCWGRNFGGQLGNNSRIDSNIPVAVAGGLRFTELSVGYEHTIAMTARGVSYGWGENGYGALGTGNFADALVPTVAMGGKRYASIGGSSPESYSQCYADRRGKLECVGYNWNNYMIPSPTPGDVTTPTAIAGITGVVSHTVGDYHICALTARGAIYCWGANWSGELGDGTITESSVPVQVR